MKKLKRIMLSIVLVLTFSISLVPTSVHAVSELYVNGVNMLLPENQNKAIPAGKGTIKYNPTTLTLELNNATIDTANTTDPALNKYLILNATPNELTISLIGTNEIIMKESFTNAIDNTQGKLTINGVGEKPTLTISSGVADVNYTGIQSNGLNIKDATINIKSYKVTYPKAAIASSDPNISNSNINIKNFYSGINMGPATIKDSTLNFEGCENNIYIVGGNLNIEDSKIYSNKNDTRSILISEMNCDTFNLTNSKIEANDGTLINGIQAFPKLNIINSTVDIITENSSFGGLKQITVANSTINALSKNGNAMTIFKSLDIKDSIINAEGGVNKGINQPAISVESDINSTSHTNHITLNDNLYVKNNRKISKSPLVNGKFYTSFIADTETELKFDLTNAAKEVHIDFKRADYTAVDAAINAVPKDLSIYTTATVNTLNTALKAVVRELKITEQAKVDKYATDINTAVKNLQLKPVEPTMSEGSNQTIKEGNDATFKSNAELKDFIKVLVDGKDVDKNNFEVKSGSTIVTLKKSYLNTLTEGSHTLEIVSKNGSAKTSFTIKKNNKPVTPKPVDPSKPIKPKAPNTGINNNDNQIFMLLLISSIGMIVIKRKEIKE
ncbi:MAG: hypothetical protein RSF69_06820 [Erysipelotrichaceae bacterium]